MTTDHASNPDQLMAQALGVFWHSPGLSALWPCTPLADWEIELLRPCGACGCTEASHGAAEGDSGCRTRDCECDAFDAPEAPYEPSTYCGSDPRGEFTGAELIRAARVMDAAGVPADAGEDAVRAVTLVLRYQEGPL